MANVAMIVRLIADGLTSKIATDRKPIESADEAIRVFYSDPDQGRNAELMAVFGELDDAEYQSVKARIGFYLAA